MPTRLLRATLFDAVALASLGAITSAVLDTEHMGRLHDLSLKVSSVTGTADAIIEYATSPDGTNFDAYSDNTALAASTLLAKAGNPEGFNGYPLPIFLNRYVRFRLTGIASNPADSLVTGYLFFDEGAF